MDTLYELTKNIVIYLIVVTILKNLIGKSSYQKYISIFTGMVLIIIVAKPLLTLFDISETFSYYFNNNNFRLESEGITDRLNASDEASKQEIINAYRGVVEEQIQAILNRYELYPVSVSSTLDLDEKSNRYGAINELKVIATFTHSLEETKEEKEKIEVKKIMINRNITMDSLEKKGKDSTKYGDKCKKIVKEIANSLGMKEDNITVLIQE